MNLRNASTYLVLVMAAISLSACNVSDDPAVVTETDPCLNQDCSGNGTCETIDDAAVCTCTGSFAGADCSTCEVGTSMVEGSCVAIEIEGCEFDNPCSENATCDDSSGTSVCICEDGFADELCDSCADGYLDVDGDCVPNIPCADADPCGDHGTCTDAATGTSCECAAGYDGSRCDECAPTHFAAADGTCVEREACASDTCNDRGTCTDTTGLIDCACEATYGGDRCEACYPGYVEVGGSCVLAQTCQAGTCFGKGTCDDATGVVACTCEPGYAAPFCNGCAMGHTGADCLTCETGYTDVNSVCTPMCADGYYVAAEVCDDGNTDPSNGTTDFCSTDCGFSNWPDPNGQWPGYIAPSVGRSYSTWTNIKLNNNSSRYGLVAAGSDVTVTGTWAYDKPSSGCSGCVTQLYLGFFSEDAANTDPLKDKPQWCERSIQTGTQPFTTTIKAPTEPGTYYLRWSRSWLYECSATMPNFGMGANLFVIYVD